VELSLGMDRSSYQAVRGLASKRISVRMAAALYLLMGAAIAISQPVIAAHVIANRRLPMLGGIRAGSGPFERVGLDFFATMAIVFTLLGLLEIVVGVLLWRLRRRGGVLALVLLPPGVALWLGFGVPVWLILGPIRLALIFLGWKALAYDSPESRSSR
jgi:hypothetical protein